MIEELRNVFVINTLEELADVEVSISNCFYKDISKDIVNHIFSIAHNIKGTAPMLGVNGLTPIVLPVEKVYSAVKSGKILLSEEIVDSTKKIIPVIKAGLTNEKEITKNQTETESLVGFFESLL